MKKKNKYNKIKIYETVSKDPVFNSTPLHILCTRFVLKCGKESFVITGVKMGV